MSVKTHAASMTFENIKFTYPGAKQETIKGVHIEILKKELVVFVGPSGCGKSTLLRISAGLLFPEKGKLLIDGNDTVRLPPEKRNIGWVPQSYALFEHLSISDNVDFGLKMAKVPRIERDKRVYDMMKLCRIEDLAHRSVRALSGGQRQRVAIARALAPNPRVLLLDEPLAALDPQLRLAIREDLELLLRESGVTTLFVTHDQSEALALADKIVVLREGVVEQIGSPEDLWNAPCNDFVAEFIGNATIVNAKTIGTRIAEIVPGLTCRTNKDILPDQELRLALRNDDLLLSEEGIDAVVTYREYNGGIYHMKAEVMQNVIVPISSLIEIPIGKSVKIAVQPHQEITVVGK